MILRDFQAAVHNVALDHEWWEDFDENDIHHRLSKLVLIHAEISEAVEELRKGNDYEASFELADAIIRILDYCEKMDIDIERFLEKKNEINKGRPFRHGGKKA